MVWSEEDTNMVAELIADVLNTSCTASLRSAIFEKVKYIGYPYPEAVKASLVQTYGKVIRGFEPLLASILEKQKFVVKSGQNRRIILCISNDIF